MMSQICCPQSIAVTNSSFFISLNGSNSLRSDSRSTNLIPFRKSGYVPNANSPTRYSASTSRNLFSIISPVKKDHDVVQLLDQWVAEGIIVQPVELRRIIRDLRSRRRFSQALQIFERISSNDAYTLSPGDCAVHLDLIGVVRGWKAAESYFTKLNDRYKNEKTYCALMYCYVRKGLIKETLNLFSKMKSLGYVSSTLIYNNLLIIYGKAGRLDKISETLSEMRENGVARDNFTYRKCIGFFGEKSHLIGIEKLLDEMEMQTDVPIEWFTYSVAAHHLIKAGRREKALTYMKKLEDNLDKNVASGYQHLITLHTHLRNVDEMMRLWALQKTCRKQINSDYIMMLGCLVKLGELDKAEVVLKEWDSSYCTDDYRVSNILLTGYCQKGLMEKAEVMLRDIVRKGRETTPNSWVIIGSAYFDNGNLEKAFACMKEVLCAERNWKWRRRPRLIRKLLNWLGDNGEFEDVEAFVGSLRTIFPMNKQMYNALIKSGVRAGRDTSSILDRMRSDGIVVDDEIEEMLRVNKMNG